jgi:prepilin-type N-terminal cleavage/methylation domain-containing protein
MKMPFRSSRRAAGFTLVELLVVIAIIVILVALAVPAILGALEKGRMVAALNAATGLEQAIDAYYDVYGALPVDSNVPFTTNGSTGGELLAVLMAKEPVSTAMKNPRKIIFFKGKESKTKRDGVFFAAAVPEGLYDPWGNPFTVVLDHDYDQTLTVAIPQAKIPNATDDGIIRNRNAAVYSLGKDPSAKLIAPKDLVRSWAK